MATQPNKLFDVSAMGFMGMDKKITKELVKKIVDAISDKAKIKKILNGELKRIGFSINQVIILETIRDLEISDSEKVELFKYTKAILKIYPPKDIESKMQIKKGDIAPLSRYHYDQAQRYDPMLWIDEMVTIYESGEEESIKYDFKDKPFKWKGKASHLGYVFKELVKHGYMEGPKSYSKFATALLDFFDVDTTHENLQKELGPRNSVTGMPPIKITERNKLD